MNLDDVIILILGVSFGTGLTYHFCNQGYEKELLRYKRELENSECALQRTKETLKGSEDALNKSKKALQSSKDALQKQTQKHNALLKSFTKDEAYIIVYVHELDGRNYKLPISTNEYFKFKQKSHRIENTSELVNFVTYNNATIIDKAKYLTKDLKTPEAKAQRLLDFVHYHFYDAAIEKERDYVRYPIETMVERNGDCEDFSILFAAFGKSIGLDVALIHFSAKKNEKSEHVAAGVVGNFKGSYFESDGKKYFYAETTGTNWLFKRATWQIGEIPKSYSKRKAKIYVVE